MSDISNNSQNNVIFRNGTRQNTLKNKTKKFAYVFLLRILEEV